SLLRHEALRLLEVVERFFLHAVHECLVALLVLLAGFAEVLAVGLRLLDLREQLLLELGGGLRVRRDHEREHGGAHDETDDGTHGEPSSPAVLAGLAPGPQDGSRTPRGFCMEARCDARSWPSSSPLHRSRRPKTASTRRPSPAWRASSRPSWLRATKVGGSATRSGYGRRVRRGRTRSTPPPSGTSTVST